MIHISVDNKKILDLLNVCDYNWNLVVLTPERAWCSCREPGGNIHQFLLVPGTWKTIQACLEGY